jgi:uncharacterized protein (UPF0335 family)
MKYIKHKKAFDISLEEMSLSNNLANTIKNKWRSETIAKEIREDIKDICQELVDDGFNTVSHKAGLAGNLECLFIGKKETFKYNEISEVIERLKEYLGDRIREMSISQGSGWVDMPKFDELRKHNTLLAQRYEYIKGIRIYYETSKG